MTASGIEVYFIHGLHGTPHGTKIRRLRRLVRRWGLRSRALDQRGLSAAERIAQLKKEASGRRPPVIFVGSSLGGYVCAAAAAAVRPVGQFLMAPAFFSGFRPPAPEPVGHIEIVHGWRDEVVPIERSLRYGRRHRVCVHGLDAGHRLTEAMDDIEGLFVLFLDKCIGLCKGGFRCKNPGEGSGVFKRERSG